VTLHLPGSLAHMLARVRAYQLRAPSCVASSSSTCERRTSGSHVPVHCAGARAACTALRRSATPDDRTRANSHVVTISACTPNHLPAPLDRSSAHAEVPCLVSLGFPSASLRCDARKTVVAPSFILSHKKRHHHHHSHL
jgi:hypothetical protein